MQGAARNASIFLVPCCDHTCSSLLAQTSFLHTIFNIIVLIETRFVDLIDFITLSQSSLMATAERESLFAVCHLPLFQLTGPCQRASLSSSLLLIHSHHQSKLLLKSLLFNMDHATGDEIDEVVSSYTYRILQQIQEQIPETGFEFYSDAVLGFGFLVTAIVAAKR